ncbi:hypothetical protein SRABI05_03510 [Agrobacterium fabrum]|nr:hypothetical protein SRABI46_03482 [Agrobacterium fabrum]CAH0271066.1 hypothetical protein SRABI05_03510 [Agrobacterium fabrum]
MQNRFTFLTIFCRDGEKYYGVLDNFFVWNDRSAAPSLIPVLVTGIQPAQVLGLEGLSRRADARRLDSCDKHRNEGGRGWRKPIDAGGSGRQKLGHFDTRHRIRNGGVEQDVAGGIGHAGEDVANLALLFAVAILTTAIGGL